MADAIVLFGGDVIMTTAISQVEYMHRTGFVGSFFLKGKKYVHCFKEKLKSVEKSTSVVNGGYFVEDILLSYMARSKEVTLDVLLTYKLKDQDVVSATNGANVIAQKLRVEFPFTEFCIVDKFTWDFIEGELLTPDDIDLAIPTRANRANPPVTIPIHPVAKSFYDRNILIITHTGYPNDRATGAYYIAMIALYIHNIQERIFPLFTGDDAFNDYKTSQNYQWTNADLFPYPYDVAIKEYLTEISEFYNALYANQKLITAANTENKLYWLGYVLSPKAMSIMPASDRIQILKSIAVGTILEATRFFDLIKMGAYVSPLYYYTAKFINPTINEERFTLNVLESILLSPTEINEFLERILFSYNIGGKSNATLFEVLYKGLDDNRIKAYSIGLLNDVDNRMKFIFLLYEMWSKSTYNPYFHSPEYVLPPVFGGVYTESYFLTSYGLTFYNPDTAPPVIAYESYSVSESGEIDTTFGTSFQYKLNGLKIEVDKVTTKITEIIYPTPDHDKYKVSTVVEKYGSYHLFQPVTLIGFKPDLDLKIPPNNIIPIFYLYYMVQYAAIKYLDYGIMLTAEIALNFTAIGQLQSLKYLAYLKYISPMRVLTAEEAVLSWTAVQGVSDALVFTGANVNATLNFISSTATDAETKASSDSANRYLGFVLLSSLSSSFFLRGKVIESAKDLTFQLDRLTDEGIPYIFDPNTENIVRGLGNNEQIVASYTRSKLLEIPQGEGLVQTYDAFENTLKLKFGKNYGQKTVDELSLLKDDGAVTPMANYKLLAEQNLIDASSTSFLLEQKRVVALNRFVQDQGVKDNLYLLTQNNRNIFLDHFGDQPVEWFNYLTSHPTAIIRWENLNAYGKLFARSKPDIWLYRFDRIYQNIPKANRLSSVEILTRFGQKGLDLVNEVELFALNRIATVSKTKRSKGDILVSGMVDKTSGKMSQFYRNFSGNDLKTGGSKDTFLTNIFPNLKTRIDDIWSFDKQNYRMSDRQYLAHTGKFPGAHAEIQALDDLAKQKFPNYLNDPPTDEVFNSWIKNEVLGYNRNIEHGINQQNVIMHTCADCFHILDLITFIRPLQ